MKNTLLQLIPLFFLLLNNSVQSQSYVPFPDSNAVWTVDDGANHSYSLIGDSIYNSHTYKKIYLMVNSQPFYYKGMTRQDIPNKKIFAVNREDTVEKLLYDFNVNVSDTVKVTPFFNGMTFSLRLDSIDSVLIQTQYRKRYNFTSIAIIQQHEFWIEGIGSSCSFFYSGSSGTSIADYCLPQLKCFWQNNILIYPGANFNFCYTSLCVGGIRDESLKAFTLFPNPAKDLVSLKGENVHKISTIVISNLLGQKELDLKGQELNGDLLLDIRGLTKGIHFLTVYFKEIPVFSQKLIRD